MQLTFGIHRNWKKDAQLIRKKFVSFYPYEPVGVGDNGYVCDEKRRSICKVYCCTKENFDVFLSPLEISAMSFSIGLPPSEFVSLSELPSYYYDPSGECTMWGILKISKKSNGHCFFLENSGCSIYSKARPLRCHAYPMGYDTKVGLIQYKGCPGFKRGKPLTWEEYEKLKLLTRVSAAFDLAEYRIDPSVISKRKFKEAGLEILRKTHVDFHMPPKELKLDQTLEGMRDVTDLDKVVKSLNLSHENIEDFLIKLYI